MNAPAESPVKLDEQLVRAVARALYRAESSETIKAMSPEMRTETWNEVRSQYLSRSRSLVRRFRHDGIDISLSGGGVAEDDALLPQ